MKVQENLLMPPTESRRRKTYQGQTKVVTNDELRPESKLERKETVVTDLQVDMEASEIKRQKWTPALKEDKELAEGSQDQPAFMTIDQKSHTGYTVQSDISSERHEAAD